MIGYLQNNASARTLWADTFADPVQFLANGGVPIGAPEILGGLRLGGSECVKYDISQTLLAYDDGITIEIEFTPEFAYTETTLRILFDTDLSDRYVIYRAPDGTHALTVYANGTLVMSVGASVYAAYWREYRRNVLTAVISDGANALYLNGQLIGSNSTAWTYGNPSQIVIGGSYAYGSNYKGVIHQVNIKRETVTATEVERGYNGKIFRFVNDSALYLNFRRNVIDGSIDRTLDLSRFGHTVLLGNGAGTGRPSVFADGLHFDGSDDYLTLPSDPTGDYTVASKRANSEVVIENDLTTWNQIKTLGGFSGYLSRLAVWPYELTPVQARELTYLWSFPR